MADTENSSLANIGTIEGQGTWFGPPTDRLQEAKLNADGRMHALWTKAVDSPDYDKEQWKLLERAIWDIGK